MKQKNTGLWTRLLKESKIKQQDMDTNGCSVVVPTFNRLSYLKKCVDSLLSLDFENFEIIIIDDGSTDETSEYLGSLGNNKIKVFYNSENLGKSRSRNRGISLAGYESIAFIDDDCVADKKWLGNLLRGFRRDQDGFVVGQTFYVERGYQGYFPERMVQNIGAKWPGAGNIVYRKKVFEKIGGFDSFYDYYNNEDSEMAVRAINGGFSGNKSKEAIVCHQPMVWTVKSLLNSARNASVWPILKKRYPTSYSVFGSPIKFKVIVNFQDYVYFITLPILIPLLLARYISHGKKDFKVFFAKWPIYFFLRRYYILKESIKNRVLMI